MGNDSREKRDWHGGGCSEFGRTFVSFHKALGEVPRLIAELDISVNYRLLPLEDV